jgi:drug/metabolite transporter (DMT)-like permease
MAGMKSLTQKQGNFLVMIVTVVWGSAFVASRFCLDNGVSPGFIIGFRGACLALLLLAFAHKKIFAMSKKDCVAGLLAGGANAIAYTLQAVGLQYASPSTAAFMTVTYIVFTPFISFLFFKKKPPLRMVFAVITALIGTYILTNMNFADFKFDIGTLICLGGALFFAVSIAILGNIGQDTPFEVTGFWMGALQVLSGLLYVGIADKFNLGDIRWGMAIGGLFYLGLIGTCFTTNAQIIAQKVSDETTVSLIMSLEAVFGTLFSILFKYDAFSVSLLLGGALIFAGVLIANAPFKRSKPTEK